MSQFPAPTEFGGYSDEPPVQKRSGLAITALILSISGIIPCCGLLLAGVGIILGLIGVVTIGRNPAVKGRGMAAVAIVIGLVFIVGWIGGGAILSNKINESQRNTPGQVLQAAIAGDVASFRDQTFGVASQASDAEIQDFAQELTDRYGALVSATFDEPQFTQDIDFESMMQPVQSYPFDLQFANATLEAEFDMGMSDPNTGSFSLGFRVERIRIIDPDRGDLVFPPNPGEVTAPPPTDPSTDDTSSDGG